MQPFRIFTIAFLFSGSLVLQVGCQTKQVAENITNNGNTQIAETNLSDEEIKQLFIDSGLGEGDGNLVKMMALPRERVVAAVQKIKDKGLKKGEGGFSSDENSESMQLKAAYFLWTLGVDISNNEQYIVNETKNRDISKKFDAISYLEIIVAEGKKEYTPIVLKAAPQADNAFAMEMQGFLVNELENSPKMFLPYLSKESKKVRQSVYHLISFTEEMLGKESFEKIKLNLEELKTDKEVKNIAEEFLREINKKN